MGRPKQHPGQAGKFYPIRRGSDIWHLAWYDEKTHQTKHESLYTTDFEEACEIVKEREFFERHACPQGPEKVTITECLLRYEQAHVDETSSPSEYRRHLRLWREFWGSAKVAEIVPDQQAAFRKQIEKQLTGGTPTPSSVDRVLTTGRAALNMARNAGRLTSFPRIILTETEIDRVSAPTRGIATTIEEIAKFFDAIEHHRLFVFTMILANTLARPAAILDLSRQQYDARENTVNLNPPGRRQTKKFRPTLPVTPTLRPWLESVSDPQQHYVAYNGKPVKSVRLWKEAACAAGLPKRYTPYSFRHGITRILKRRGVSRDQREQVLGHLPSGGKMATVYDGGIDPYDCDDAMKAIEQIMQEVRQLVRVANLDDPFALADADMRNNGIADLVMQERPQTAIRGVGSIRLRA